jgi:DNA-binding GntR family transcriptional regulator
MTDSPNGSSLRVSRAPRSTLQDHVYRELCELILDGGIAPGQSVTIQTLADAFGVSAMPVREALQRLTAARVLQVISGRSIGIPPLSRERMVDLRRVRLEVEALAAEWATSRMTPSDFVKLDDLLYRAELAADEGARDEYLRLNRAIHFTIYRASGSDALFAIIENLWLQVSPYFHFLYSSGNFHQAKEKHAQMLAGLRARDPDMVRTGLIEDIEAAGRVLDELLQSEAAGTAPPPAPLALDVVTAGSRNGRVLGAPDGLEHRIDLLLQGRDAISMADMLQQLGFPPDESQGAVGQRVGRILQARGWERTQRRLGGRPVRIYVAPAR